MTSHKSLILEKYGRGHNYTKIVSEINTDQNEKYPFVYIASDDGLILKVDVNNLIIKCVYELTQANIVTIDISGNNLIVGKLFYLTSIL